MANIDNPSGLKPARSLIGGEIRLTSAALHSANSQIGLNHPLTLLADGTYQAWSNGLRLDAVSAQAVAANTGGTILVYSDPFIVFHAQTDNGTGTLTAQTAVGLNANILAGSVNSYGLSTAEIDESSGATTNTLPVTVLGLAPTEGNDFGEFNVLEIIRNPYQVTGI